METDNGYLTIDPGTSDIEDKYRVLTSTNLFKILRNSSDLMTENFIPGGITTTTLINQTTKISEKVFMQYLYKIPDNVINSPVIDPPVIDPPVINTPVDVYKLVRGRKFARLKKKCNELMSRENYIPVGILDNTETHLEQKMYLLPTNVSSSTNKTGGGYKNNTFKSKKSSKSRKHSSRNKRTQKKLKNMSIL